MTQPLSPDPLSGLHQHHDEGRRAYPQQNPPPGPVERPLVDVRDMIVVHTAILREFRLAPQAVARVPAGANRPAGRVNAHLELLCDLLHHHHAGEDELLWPPLRPLLTADGQARLDEAEAQHADIDAALRLVNATRLRWNDLGDEGSRNDLVTGLRHLHDLLLAHLDTEERELLPLAATHLTTSQWAAIGEAGAAHISKSKTLLVFGMFAYEGNPEVLATMLHSAPLPARAIVPLLAPRVYARYAKRIHGTPRP